MAEYRITPDRNQTRGWNLFSLFGIPVYIEPWFLLTIALIFMLNTNESGRIDVPRAGIFSFIVFISVLVHEFGHAIVARAMGCDSIRIVLGMFGGYATHSPTTRGKSLLIIAAGPGFGLVLGILAYIVMRSEFIFRVGTVEAMEFFLINLVFLNIFWTLFNIIPIHPLDGGQALFHGLTYWFDPNKSMLFVSRLSMVLCVLVGAYGYQHGQTIIAIFCLSFFMSNWQISRMLG